MVNVIPTIQPFTYQASTAFQERVQLANKLNEVIDALNQIGDIEDLQTQIDTINSTITQIQTQIGEQNIEISTLTGQINALISDVNSLTTRVSTAETDIGAIEQDISTIQTDIQEIDTEIKGLQGELISEIELVSSPHGSLQVVITHKDETQTTSPAIDLGLVQEGGITLQTGSTDRSFKLLINLTDGTSWQTNDFIIPEGGGTDVNITSISISQGTTADQIQFNVGLSDGSSIASNDWDVVTPTEFAALQSMVSGNSSQISNLNGRVRALEDAPSFALSPATATQLGGVKIGTNVTVQADGTISVNLSSYALKSEIPDVSQFVTETKLIQDLADYMTAEDVAAAYQPKGDYLTEVPIGGTAIGGVKNGGNVTIETDGTMNVASADEYTIYTESLSNLRDSNNQSKYDILLELRNAGFISCYKATITSVAPYVSIEEIDNKGNSPMYTVQCGFKGKKLSNSATLDFTIPYNGEGNVRFSDEKIYIKYTDIIYSSPNTLLLYYTKSDVDINVTRRITEGPLTGNEYRIWVK